MNFDIIALNTGILRIVWRILTQQPEAETLIEINGPDHIA
jgi:hypothetical protein